MPVSYENGHDTPQMMCLGIRGATTAEDNTAEAILAATRELLYLTIRANNIRPEEVASAFFTTTSDLNATYPALAARQLGWYDVALLCGHEMDVPGGVARCIRLLIHWNTTRRPDEIVHVYIGGAKNLRPDRHTLPLIPAEELEAAIHNLSGISVTGENPSSSDPLIPASS